MEENRHRRIKALLTKIKNIYRREAGCAGLGKSEGATRKQRKELTCSRSWGRRTKPTRAKLATRAGHDGSDSEQGGVVAQVAAGGDPRKTC